MRKLVPFLALLAVTCASGVSDETRAHRGAVHNMSALREGAAKLREELDVVRLNARAALLDYNAIVDGTAAKPQNKYKELLDRVAALERAHSDADERKKGVQTRIDRYFEQWSAEIATFTDPELRAESQRRYDEARERFTRLRATLQDIAADYDVFLENLREQTMFLGRDLSPEGTAMLRPRQEKLNAQATELGARITEVQNALREREAAIHPREP